MPKYPDRLLDEIRAALPVSTVVARRCKDLKRAGAEWKCLSPFNKERTPSFTVNDAKGMWWDFSSGKSGNIFQFEMEATGCTFGDAVQTLAALAGVPLPRDASVPAAGRRDDLPDMPPDVPPPDSAPRTVSQATRQITKTYPYTDADGGLLYEVVRLEWVDKGKRKKTFLQRRPVPDEPGRWIWGLGAGLFLRGRGGDFYQATDKRLEEWAGAEQRTFDDEVTHGLYRFPELREEMAQDADDRRTIYLCEGEKDSETLASWGLVATTNSGGAAHWLPHHSEELRGADVVIPMDNDKAGRERGHKVAASLRGIADRVRVVDIRELWPTTPDHGDVTDWRDHGAGNAEKLMAFVDKVQPWVPAPPESSFNAMRFVDLDRPARELEWLIKKVLTRNEVSIWYGAPGSGKTFLMADAAMAVARSVPWMGLRTRPGLVVYQAGEGVLGLKKRLRAYRKHHRIPAGEDVPLVLLPARINLFMTDADVVKLITEIKAWAAFYDVPLELVVIDTLSAATPGANENDSKDITLVLERCRRIAFETGAHVALVHHTPKAGGSPRGWSGLAGNVESMIEVVRTEEVDQEVVGASRILRDVREFTVVKQKDAEDRTARRFVLKKVVLGIDVDGDEDSSCVVDELAHAAQRVEQVPVGWAQIRPDNLDVFKALVRALRDHGRTAPDGVQVSKQEICCTVGEWQAALTSLYVGHEEITPTLKARIKKKIFRACKYWDQDSAPKLIGKADEWVWRSDRKVAGIDAPPRPVREPPKLDDEPGMLLAPGESPDDRGAF